MSTRCQIAFITEGTSTDPTTEQVVAYREERWVYRHSDGYPGDGTPEDWGVLCDLKEFLQWNGGRNADVEYTAANFLFWSKYQNCRYVRDGKGCRGERRVDWSNPPRQLTGFGVCKEGEFHADIDFFYEVITANGTTRIITYRVDHTAWDNPVTRENLTEVRS